MFLVAFFPILLLFIFPRLGDSFPLLPSPPSPTCKSTGAEVAEEIKKVPGLAADPPPVAMSGSSLMNFVRRAQEEDSSSDEEDGKTQWLEIRGHTKIGTS